MRSVDRLEQQRRRKRQQRHNTPAPDETLEDELEHPRALPLTQQKSVFDAGADRSLGGINTAPSVFDRSAAIRTDE